MAFVQQHGEDRLTGFTVVPQLMNYALFRIHGPVEFGENRLPGVVLDGKRSEDSRSDVGHGLPGMDGPQTNIEFAQQ